MALKPAQPKVDAKPVEVKKPLDAKPVDVKPIEGKPVEVKPGDVAGGTPAPIVDANANVDGEQQKKKPDWNTFSSVAMSKIPVSTPMRGSVLSARIDVLKKPKPAVVAEESDD